MSFSMNNPLILGDINAPIKKEIGNLEDLDTTDKSSLVNALNEALDSTLNGASRDLSNLSDVGTQKLRSLNAYANEGELLTDAEGLAFVKKYAHSTFDLSKFTVVGSPTITDDGIASGFSSSNYIQGTTISSNSNWAIIVEFTTPNTLSSSVETLCFNYLSGNTNNRSEIFINYGNLAGSINVNGTFIATTASGRYQLSTNTNYFVKMEFTGTSYKLFYSLDGSSWTQIWSVDNSTNVFQQTFRIGNNADLTRAFTGSIDLKQFSITVDGVEVFSGNRIGIDTIKPDDYTIVNNGRVIYAYSDGTHTIYANSSTAPTTLYNADGYEYTGSDFTVSEGVVYYGETACTYTSADNITLYLDITDDSIISDYASSNYVTLPINASSLAGKSWDISLRMQYTEDTNKRGAQGISFGSKFPLKGFVGLMGNGIGTSARDKKILICGGNNATILSYSYTNLGVQIGDYINILATYDNNTTTYNLYASLNNNPLTLVSTTVSANTVDMSSRMLRIGCTNGNGDNVVAKMPVDMNGVKVVVNGDLVCQGCLKIPYTESKTGSKIVDSIYRDRVNDMAEQFGYANYYTLSDTDFTLPQVELYGLIGQRTLRDSYRNGINYWELYSNRDLEQGGSCTSGVEVTFARPFADTNYVLSVPYSAKSTTAFTPTQTGDWIAKGKGIL